jgi:aminoglycoside phosphotransferase (APT) family kinase protein
VAERAPRPRASGKRLHYSAVPPHVRSWIDARIGPSTVVTEHIGGMSPGCATTLVTDDGHSYFVKAVGAELNSHTPALFRRERALLQLLPHVSYRPRLRDWLDDGGWVALLFDAVEGRHPDLGNPADIASVAHVLRQQAVELTPVPEGAEARTIKETARIWFTRWQSLPTSSHARLPAWVSVRFDEHLDRVSTLSDSLEATTLCHFDVRDDNLLVRPDGSAVVVDWGIPRVGPPWVDLLLLAVQHPNPSDACALVRATVPPDAQQSAATFLLGFAGSQAWNAAQAHGPGLPEMARFCRDDARRLFAVARLLG